MTFRGKSDTGVTAVWKFPVPINGWFEQAMPAGAEVLCVAVQGGAPFMWAKVDPNAPSEAKAFYLLGTGHMIEDTLELRHIGSFMLDGDRFVGHLFEVR